MRGLKPPPIAGLMYSGPEAQSLLSSRGGPCANDIAVGTNGRGVPGVVLRIPGVKVAMMIRQRHEDSGARLFVARDQLVGIPVEQRPLRAELLVSEARCRPVMIEVILVLPLPLDVDIPRVPVSGFGHALGAPMSPDAELGVAIPVRRFVLEQ